MYFTIIILLLDVLYYILLLDVLYEHDNQLQHSFVGNKEYLLHNQL